MSPRHSTCLFAARLLFLASISLGTLPLHAQKLPPPAQFPSVPPAQPPNSISMQDPAIFPEVKMDFPIAEGPYQPTWESIDANHTYRTRLAARGQVRHLGAFRSQSAGLQSG